MEKRVVRIKVLASIGVAAFCFLAAFAVADASGGSGPDCFVEEQAAKEKRI